MIKVLLLLLFFSPLHGYAQQPTAEGVANEKLQSHAHALKAFAEKQDCSEKLGILVDLSINSRENRFYIVDLENDSVLLTGLCAQGQGDNVNREEVIFSNTPGSYCSSEGRYKLGVKFKGEFGTGYRLFGLDASNSNALMRGIVFHSHPGVADVEDARVVCRSYGCPMVSPKVFRVAEKLIDASDKPVLMWIYK